MSDIEQIVNISITRQTQAVQRAGFGIPNILGDSDLFAKVDGAVITIDATLVASNSIAWKFNGATQVSIPWDSDNDTTMANWATAIQALGSVATAGASDVGAVGYHNTITVVGAADPARCVFSEMVITLGASQAGITQVYDPHTRIEFYSTLASLLVAGGGVFATTDPEYIAANAIFSQNPRVTQLAVSQKRSGDGDWQTALAAIIVQNNTWYGLCVTDRTKAVQEAVATWVEANKKIFAIASNDAVIITAGTSDIAATLESSARVRSNVIYHPNADETDGDEFPDAAWLGRCLPTDPGSITWSFKTLSGVTAVILTTSEQNYALGKNCNIYTEIGGVNITRFGTMASGEYIDIIRGVDWIESRMEEAIYALLVRLPKVPFNDPGIQAIAGEVKKILDSAIDRGILTENTDEDRWDGKKYYILTPKSVDVSSADKAARTLNDVEFEALLAGAIHTVAIAGIVTL